MRHDEQLSSERVLASVYVCVCAVWTYSSACVGECKKGGGKEKEVEAVKKKE